MKRVARSLAVSCVFDALACEAYATPKTRNRSCEPISRQQLRSCLFSMADELYPAQSATKSYGNGKVHPLSITSIPIPKVCQQHATSKTLRAQGTLQVRACMAVPAFRSRLETRVQGYNRPSSQKTQPGRREPISARNNCQTVVWRGRSKSCMIPWNISSLLVV